MTYKLTALDAIKDIVGDRVLFCSSASEGHYAVCTPLLAAFKDGMFAPCDPKFGVVGIIGIPRPTSSLSADIACAVHESFHAWLHCNNGDWQNEETVNNFSSVWLRRKMSGFSLFAALEHILSSRLSYKTVDI